MDSADWGGEVYVHGVGPDYADGGRGEGTGGGDEGGEEQLGEEVGTETVGGELELVTLFGGAADGRE